MDGDCGPGILSSNITTIGVSRQAHLLSLLSLRNVNEGDAFSSITVNDHHFDFCNFPLIIIISSAFSPVH